MQFLQRHAQNQENNIALTQKIKTDIKINVFTH